MCTTPTQKIKTTVNAFLIAGLFLVAFVSLPTSLHAVSAFTATVDIVGGGAVIVGEPVTLQWYVTGGPASCSINHGVGDFEVTSDPQSGTVAAVPPETGDPFIITCTRGGAPGSGGEIATDTLVVIPNPVITFTSYQGTSLVNGLSGAVYPRIKWESQYATECSEISYTNTLNPTPASLSIWGYRDYDHDGERDRYQTSGEFRPGIDQTTTFYITCQNTALGTESTKTITITVVDPPPPEPVWIDVIRPVDNPADVTRDEGRNYSTTRVEFRAMNSTYCNDYRAYNVHEYPTIQTAIPEGWSAWSGALHRRTNMRLGTSTILTVTCGRPEVTVAGISYPATSTTLVKQINVDGDLLVETSSSTSPYAQVLMTATPNPAVRHALTGTAYVTVNVTASNADYCKLHSYRVSDGSRYTVPGWLSEGWRRYWTDTNQDLDRILVPELAESTDLVVTCQNLYHHYYGTEEERANANVVSTTTVTIKAPAGVAQEPDVWLYSGPSVHMDSTDIWENQTDVTNYQTRDDRWNNRPGEYTLQVTPNWTRTDGVYYLTSGTGSISFPFNHPHGAGQSDVYNIHMRYCDESDGASVYTFSSDASGELGTFTSDMTYPGQENDCRHESVEVAMVAEGVILSDGDIITVECTPGSAGEWQAEHCEFSDLYFGTGSGNRTVTVPVDPDAPLNQLIWMSQYATKCFDMEAETTEGAEYSWSNSNATYGSLTDPALGSVTTYDITCNRAIDNVETVEEVEVIISTDPDLPLDEEETVSDEVEYDIGACYDVESEPDVLLPNAPDYHVVAPDNLQTIPDIFVLRANQCVPLVDLSVAPVHPSNDLATDSIVNIADGVDNVNGTFDLSIIPYVQNLAEVDLPANSQISYSVNFGLPGSTFNVTENGNYNTLLPANTPLGTYQLTNMAVPGVQFGTYDVDVRFNLDGAPNYPDSGFANNTYANVVALPVPEPHMTVLMPDGNAVIDNSAATVDVPLVRSGVDTDLNWSVNVNYPMNCTLTGPSIGTQALTLGTVGSNTFGSNPSTDSISVNLQSTAEFELACTEPTTATTFVQTGYIEVVPNFQEL